MLDMHSLNGNKPGSSVASDHITDESRTLLVSTSDVTENIDQENFNPMEENNKISQSKSFPAKPTVTLTNQTEGHSARSPAIGSFRRDLLNNATNRMYYHMTPDYDWLLEDSATTSSDEDKYCYPCEYFSFSNIHSGITDKQNKKIVDFNTVPSKSSQVSFDVLSPAKNLATNEGITDSCDPALNGLDATTELESMFSSQEYNYPRSTYDNFDLENFLNEDLDFSNTDRDLTSDYGDAVIDKDDSEYNHEDEEMNVNEDFNLKAQAREDALCGFDEEIESDKRQKTSCVVDFHAEEQIEQSQDCEAAIHHYDQQCSAVYNINDDDDGDDNDEVLNYSSSVSSSQRSVDQDSDAQPSWDSYQPIYLSISDGGSDDEAALDAACLQADWTHSDGSVDLNLSDHWSVSDLSDPGITHNDPDNSNDLNDLSNEDKSAELGALNDLSVPDDLESVPDDLSDVIVSSLEAYGSLVDKLQRLEKRRGRKDKVNDRQKMNKSIKFYREALKTCRSNVSCLSRFTPHPHINKLLPRSDTGEQNSNLSDLIKKWKSLESLLKPTTSSSINVITPHVNPALHTSTSLNEQGNCNDTNTSNQSEHHNFGLFETTNHEPARENGSINPTNQKSAHHHDDSAESDIDVTLTLSSSTEFLLDDESEPPTNERSLKESCSESNQSDEIKSVAAGDSICKQLTGSPDSTNQSSADTDIQTSAELNTGERSADAAAAEDDLLDVSCLAANTADRNEISLAGIHENEMGGADKEGYSCFLLGDTDSAGSIRSDQQEEELITSSVESEELLETLAASVSDVSMRESLSANALQVNPVLLTDISSPNSDAVAKPSFISTQMDKSSLDQARTLSLDPVFGTSYVPVESNNKNIPNLSGSDLYDDSTHNLAGSVGCDNQTGESVLIRSMNVMTGRVRKKKKLRRYDRASRAEETSGEGEVKLSDQSTSVESDITRAENIRKVVKGDNCSDSSKSREDLNKGNTLNSRGLELRPHSDSQRDDGLRDDIDVKSGSRISRYIDLDPFLCQKSTLDKTKDLKGAGGYILDINKKKSISRDESCCNSLLDKIIAWTMLIGLFGLFCLFLAGLRPGCFNVHPQLHYIRGPPPM